MRKVKGKRESLLVSDLRVKHSMELLGLNWETQKNRDCPINKMKKGHF